MSGMFFLMISLGVFFVWIVLVEPRWYHLKRVEVRLKRGLHSPLSVLLLCDMHFPILGRPLEKYFSAVLSRLEPDFIMIAGDLIDHDRGIEQCVRAIKNLKAKFGIYVVFGNHDYARYGLKQIARFNAGKTVIPDQLNDIERLKGALGKAGCHILQNDSVCVENSFGTLRIVGIDDSVSGKADVRKSFEKVRKEEPCIVLTHSIDALSGLGDFRADLALAGHTHGGQIRFPVLGLPPMWNHCRLGRKYAAGLAEYGSTVTYTSRGLGVGNLFFFRFLCRPEATWLEIR